MEKYESKRGINFLIDKDKATLLSAFAMKEKRTLAKLLESLIDNYIRENYEQAKKFIDAYELNFDITKLASE